MTQNTTKQKIIETMSNIIAEKGYDNASIGQIAEAIGIKKASIYYYFESKKEIFIQMVQEIYSGDYSNKMEFFKTSITAESYCNGLIMMGEKFIDSYFANHNLRKLYAEIDIQTTRIPELKKIVKVSDDNFNQFLIECMVHGVSIGAFTADFNTKLNAQILYTILVGIDQAILYDLSIKPKDVWKEIILKMFTKSGC